MDDVLALAQPNEEVIRLYVSMDEALRVDVLQSAQQLRWDHGGRGTGWISLGFEGYMTQGKGDERRKA